MNAPQPFFFGDFIQSCGGPSDDTVMKTDGGCADGCFGMRIGGGGIKTTNTAEKDENDEDPTAVIAQAMNTLSMQEREQAYEDMHGVSAMVLETPQMIAETLHQMEQCLQKIHHKPGYDLAVTIRGDYARDPKLRLMFSTGRSIRSPIGCEAIDTIHGYKIESFWWRQTLPVAYWY
jgi:hypothetical protein